MADLSELSARLGALTPESRGRLRARLGARTAGPAAAGGAGAQAPMSFGQQRLFLLEQMRPGFAAYNETNLMRLPHPVDPAVLGRALSEVVERHAVLRSRFFFDGDAAVQEALPPEPVALPLVDLRHLQPEAREAEAVHLAAELGRPAFDLAAGRPLRALLIRLAPDDHALAFTVHHITTDGWSHGVIVLELMTLYWSTLAGQPSPLKPVPMQYADVARLQRRSRTGDDHLAYWRARLAGLPRVEIPPDRPRPGAFSYRGARLPFALDRDVHAGLGRLAREEGVTIATVAMAGFFALMRRLTGTEDLVLGCPTSGRSRPEYLGLVGFFVNTLVIRVDLAGAGSFRGALRRVHAAMSDALAHQEMPFEQLVEQLQPPRDKSHTPFFQVMFQLWDAPKLPGLPSTLERPLTPVGIGTCKFDLTVELIRAGGETRGHLEYATDLFERERVEGLLSQYLILLAQAVVEPDLSLDALRLMTEADRTTLLTERNATRTPYPRDTPLDALVARWADETPEAPAVEAGGAATSYGALWRRAAAVADGLRREGAGPGDRIGVLMGRDPEVAAVLLGILRLGAAFVPLDPSHPAGRLAALARDADLRLIVGEGGTHDLPVPVLPIAALVAEGGAGDGPGRLAEPEAPACILYTSGTTGQPKGVVLTHRNVVRLVTGQDFGGWGRGVRSLHFAPLAFDASLFEIWGPLANGGTVVVHPPGLPSLAELGAFIRTARLDVVFLTTSLLHRMIESEAASLRGVSTLLAGGEAMQPATARAAWRALPRTRIVNAYGPTESSSIATAWTIDGPRIPEDHVPIGRPINNTAVYVLDAFGQPAPVGTPGEIHLGGDGVAAGYWRREDIARERFVPDRFGGGGRLFRTGDIGSWRPDGLLRFHGRRDRQVKLSGYRIELAEVEAAVAACEGVSAAAAVLVEDPVPRLVAFAAPGPGAALTSTALERSLAGRLPRYMQPSSVVIAGPLPLTPSGKLDLKALAEAERQAVPARGHAAPTGPVEVRLAAIWRELLPVEAPGREDSFFDLGGHSLLAMRLLSRVRDAFSTEIRMARFFDDPTIRGLAEAIAAETAPR